jgi:putative ABC transport system ATP-binding protein
MTLTQIIDTFKTKLNPSKIMNSLERAADFYDGSGNDSEENYLGKGLKKTHTAIQSLTLLKVLA